MKHVLMWFLIVSLNGCALLDRQQEPVKRDVASPQKLNDLLTRLKQDPTYQSFTMEIATGQNEAQAIRQARLNLAEQIIVDVQSSTIVGQSRVTTEAEGQTLVQTERQAHNLASAFTSVELEDAQTLERGLVDGLNYAIVGVKSDATERMRQAARKRFSSLALVNQISQTQDLTQRLTLAGKGLTEAQRMNVLDDRVVVADMPDNITFGGYFDFVVQSSIEQLSVAVEKGNEFVRITLFNRETLNPVAAGLLIKVNGQNYTTSSDGSIVLNSMTEQASLDLILADKTYPLERFSVKRAHSKLYLYTEPAGFVAEVYENNTLLQTVTTPQVLNVVFSNTNHNIYKVKFHPKDDFPAFETYLTAHEGYDVFVNKTFAPKTYGRLAVSLKSGFLGSVDFNYSLKDAHYQTLVAKAKNDFDQPIAVGRYEFELRHDSGDEKYQIVEETILVQQDQVETRRYYPPIDREYSRSGGGLMLGMRFGRTPTDNANIKTSESTSSPKFSNGFEFYGGYEKYWTNTLVGGDLSFYSLGNKDSSQDSGSGFGLSVYGGLYFGKGTREFGFINAGYSQLTVDGEYSAGFRVDHTYDLDLSSAFAEAGYDFGNGFRLSYRHFVSDTVTGQLALTMSGSLIGQGYKKPARVKAREGEHYDRF